MLAEKTTPRLLHLQRQLHINSSLETPFFREENASLTQNFHQLEEKFKEKVGYFALCRYLCIAKVIMLCHFAEPKRTANVVVMNYLRTTASIAHLDDSTARFERLRQFPGFNFTKAGYTVLFTCKRFCAIGGTIVDFFGPGCSYSSNSRKRRHFRSIAEVADLQRAQGQFHWRMHFCRSSRLATACRFTGNYVPYNSS